MIQKSAFLKFPKGLINEPVISRVIRGFDVEVNILQASITPEEDGNLFAFFSGERSAVSGALNYLKERDVRVILPARNLVWDEDRCVHCSACVGQCPSSAFSIEAESREVSFEAERCIACELCVPACSYGAVEPISDQLRKAGEL
ncbi:MAG: 4Fe-4S binding protein [Deltaproteobacteria bacterium]|nr:4Fe-4S binding protein [Deltaproteobacteria bacterium]